MIIDEDFLLVAAHVDEATKVKIRNFEYIDFGKLLPCDKILEEEDHRLMWINKGGQPWLVPAADAERLDKGEVITSFSKWDQAFKIYSDILMARFPDKTGELLQYNHIIQTASQTFVWDNIYRYDKDFRIHISNHPDRTWSTILQLSWSLRLKEKIKGEINYLQRKGGSTPKGEHYRRFQHGKCTFGLNCKYDHRCTICNKSGHGAHICRARKPGGHQYGRTDRDLFDKEEKWDRYDKCKRSNEWMYGDKTKKRGK